jgi:acetoin utilization deacetylase AcuC-like enzyme
MTTRLYTHPIYLEHLTPAGHPERPDRIKAIEAQLEEPDFEYLDRKQSPQGDEASILLAHPESYMEDLRKKIPEEGIVRIESDTTVSPKSWEAALTAVGAATAAVDDVFKGEASNVFVAARPPGHHAEKVTAMGFCLFNTAAIAARHAQKKHGATRVAIMDWDVHHGNGTQDIFWDDPSVLYLSTHQMPLYPGTGAKNETGTSDNIVNAPLSPDSGSELFREAMRSRVFPAIQNFAPDLIIISAGFDAHHRDPLAQINLVEDDFDWATGKLMDLAERSGNRLVSLLEGGYDLQGLAFSVGAHVKRLMKG